MPKPLLSPNQHIAEMNRRLRLRSEYRDGMAFVPSLEAATGRSMSGYTVTGPWDLIGIYAQVAHEVAEHFDLEV